MQYSEGRLGRVFTVRIDDGEDLIETISRFAEEKAIRSGLVLFLGALREARMVTGPQAPVIPPTPHFEQVEGAWETFGVASIYPKADASDRPSLHIHASVGRGEEALTGCLREMASVYLVIEAVILEFVDLKAVRAPDEMTGINLPVLETKTR